MPPEFVTILGVRFFAGTVEEAVERMQSGGHRRWVGHEQLLTRPHRGGSAAPHPVHPGAGSHPRGVPHRRERLLRERDLRTGEHTERAGSPELIGEGAHRRERGAHVVEVRTQLVEVRPLLLPCALDESADLAQDLADAVQVGACPFDVVGVRRQVLDDVFGNLQRGLRVAQPSRHEADVRLGRVQPLPHLFQARVRVLRLAPHHLLQHGARNLALLSIERVAAGAQTDDHAFVNEAAKRGVFAYITDTNPQQLQDSIEWGKQNLADLTQKATDLEIRWTNEGTQWTPEGEVLNDEAPLTCSRTHFSFNSCSIPIHELMRLSACSPRA